TVRRFHPDCKIVLGGHHPTALPETVMTCNHVDFVLRGEGEVSMPALAGALKQGTSLNTVPGIVFRKPDNALHISEPVFMDTPDDYPLPAMNLINQKFYRRGKKGSTVVVTSRGCPMKCSYCSLGSSSVTYRRRNIDAVIREIDTAVKNNQAGFIDFEDENLSLEKPWFMNLLREITHRFHEYDIELRAMNGLFPPSLDEEIISAMKQAGFKTLNLSLGSTSGRQLARFNRPDVRKSLENALSLAAKYHLQSVSYVIAGAPFQRPEDSISDLVYLAGKNTIAGVSIFYPSPESADYRLCEKAEILPENFSMMRSSAIPLSHTTTRTESVTLLRLGRIVNFIKSLADVGIPVPEPCSYTEQKVLAVKDRTKTGKLLLSWFLYDGEIRGVTDDGEIYDHEISTGLTRLFISSLRKAGGVGIRT
ncbi:MAG: B12-binding domain-containing radical SAM protein, partial [Desulfobacterales bacterium]|nr:B12-binding domain-containing radical SAM protein [Desulfobacterales bacterium]